MPMILIIAAFDMLMPLLLRYADAAAFFDTLIVIDSCCLRFCAAIRDFAAFAACWRKICCGCC